MIKYSRKSWGSGDLPREGKNVIKLTYAMNFCISAFHIAWNHINGKAEKVLRPKNLYASYLMPDMSQILAPVLTGDFCIISNPDIDEWWMDFEDSDLIFYSPGA